MFACVYTAAESVIKEKGGRANSCFVFVTESGCKTYEINVVNRHNPQGHLSLISVCFLCLLVALYSLSTHNVGQLNFLQGRVYCFSN